MTQIEKALTSKLRLALAAVSLSLTALSSSRGQTPALNSAMSWTDATPPEKGYLHGAFRKELELKQAPAMAQLQVFAYMRYQLFINGQYVARGPNRFELLRPEYDSFDVTKYLRAGKNVVAVLVHRDLPSGRLRQHAPGLALELRVRDRRFAAITLRTDTSWTAFADPTFGPQPAAWSSFPENRDARNLEGDWTALAFDARTRPHAVRVPTVNAEVWPAPVARTIPLRRETDIAWSPRSTGAVARAGATFTVHPGDSLLLETPRIVQAYYALDIDAPAGVRIEARALLPQGEKGAPNYYITRAGRQRWIDGDTWGLKALSITVSGGAATLTNARLVEVLYPFDRVGRFASSDPLLERVWDISTRSVMLLSEDAYVDCADRERVEWMDEDPPAYDVTRVAFAGPGRNGTPAFSDGRLMKNMLRRIALTQRDDGMMKAHTTSERWTTPCRTSPAKLRGTTRSSLAR